MGLCHQAGGRARWLAGLALVLMALGATPSHAAAGAPRGGRVEWKGLAPALLAQAPRLDPKVLRLALFAVRHVRARGRRVRPILAVIDYGLPSTRRRLWVFDLARRRLLFHLLVAHGRGSGANRATRFSNRAGSLATSLGLYLAAGTYQGKHGYSLVLRGLDPGFDDHAAARRIVVHGAWYVSRAFARAHGRLGRSWGCPAVSPAVSRRLIDALKHGGLVFAYAPDPAWLAGSTLLPRASPAPHPARASRASRRAPAGR